MTLTQRLRRIADRIEAYADKPAAIKQAIRDSVLIGADGELIAVHNDHSKPAGVRAAAGRAAGMIARLRNGRSTASTVVTCLRLEADEMDLANAGSDDPPLSDTDVAILSELLAMCATADSPQTRETIAERLRWNADGKRAFKPLIAMNYVRGCRHGYYLTEAGKQRAERLR